MRIISILLVGITSSGCASWFLKGAEQHRGGAPPGVVAIFSVPACKLAATGETLPGPDGSYHLASTPKGPRLYELDSSGSGSAIKNYWSDPAGHHFATYVTGKQAWEYTIPDDRRLPGTRTVYTQYHVQKMPGGFRIQGQPFATCVMINPTTTQAAAEPMPAPTPAEASAAPPPQPASTAAPAALPAGQVCAPGATQECVGPAACRGGQRCLPDGSGFSECDCGR
jgi:hypothetical protein